MGNAVLPRSGGGVAQDSIQVLRPNGNYQHIDVAATSTASGATFDSNTVRISTTVDICYDIGPTPVAIGASTSGATSFLPAGGVEYVEVVPNSDKIAVIAQDETTASGVVYLAEMG